VDDLAFSTSYWYDDVDFIELEARFGSEWMHRVYFHILAFEANKAASLAPEVIDLGPYADLVTDSFWELWETFFRHVWAVWRYENDLPDYRLPRPAGGPALEARPVARARDGKSELLVLCGGGKDSLAGGTGDDAIFGQAGNDFPTDRDGSADVLRGAADHDTADIDAGVDNTSGIETLLT